MPPPPIPPPAPSQPQQQQAAPPSPLSCCAEDKPLTFDSARLNARRKERYIILTLMSSQNETFFPGWDRRAPPCLKLPTLDLLVQFAIRGVRLSGDMQYFEYWFRNLFLFWKLMYIGCHSRCPCWTTTFSHRVLDHLPSTRLKEKKEGLT